MKGYRIKLIEGDGYCLCSLDSYRKTYSYIRKKEPKGTIVGPFKDKEYKRGTILKKLGKWQSKKKPGINSQCRKKLS